MSMLLIGYEQKTQTLEMLDVVKTVLAREPFELLSIIVS